MSVVISDEILQASGLSSSEFRLEIALHLFQTGRLTLGYASLLAGLEQKSSPNKPEAGFVSSKYVRVFLQPTEKAIRYSCPKS